MALVLTARRLRLILILVVVVAAALSLAGYFYVNAVIRASFPSYDGTVSLPGMTAPVRVYRDADGVPQLVGSDAGDLFRAQGYVQAQDRFWQMDVGRHYAAGRLSEMFGGDTLQTDRLMRTLGFEQVVDQELAQLDPLTRGYLDAFAAGVNAEIGGRSTSDLAVEYSLLGQSHPGYRPPPWTAADSLLWLKALDWQLRSNLGDEVQRSLLAETLTPDQIDFLYPQYPYDRNPVIVPTGGIGADGAFHQDAPQPPVLPSPVQQELGRLAQTLGQVPSLLGPTPEGGTADGAGSSNDGVGSNAWVVSGRLTSTGKPLLAADPHLGATTPTLWYQVGLRCTQTSAACPFDVTGLALPGTPGVLVGHNASVSWAFTNSQVDVTDLYLELVDDATQTYQVNGQPQPLTVRRETINVAGSAPVVITVRNTRDGPLLSDAVDDYRAVGQYALVASGSPARPPAGYGVALRWTALDPDHTMTAILALDQATDWASFRAAAAQLDVPSQDVVYADTAGNIGFQLTGRVPIRAAGDGRWPEPGWTDQYRWTGYIPFAALPTELNPTSGYIVAANNAVTGPAYPYDLTGDWDDGYRAARITTLLGQEIGAGRKITPADMTRIQGDTLNPLAAQLVPLLLAQPVDAFTAQAQNLLRGWDGTQPANSAAAAYFNAVWADILKMSFWNKLPPGVRPDGGARWTAVVSAMLSDPESSWWNDPRTPLRETRDGVLVAAMKQARLDLTAKAGKDPTLWTWGEVHTVPMRDATFGVSGPTDDRWVVDGPPLQVGGGSTAVDATSWDAAQGFGVTVAPAARLLVDVGNLDASRWVLATGESGHASHPDATDQAGLWASGRTIAWPFTLGTVTTTARHTLVLRPPPAPAEATGPPGTPTAAASPGVPASPGPADVPPRTSAPASPTATGSARVTSAPRRSASPPP